MNYKSRGKERKIKGFLIKCFRFFRFRSIHLHFSEKIILIGNSLLLISLFQDWVINTHNFISWNSFTSLAGNIGFPFFIGILFSFFCILSKNQQSKLKLYSNMSFQNYNFIGLFGIFVIISVIMSLSFIHGFVTFSQNISYGNGTILGLTSGIFILVGAYFMRQNYKANNIEIFVSQDGKVKEKISNKNNMSLPF